MGAACDITVTADFSACCEESMCSGNAVTAQDHVCDAGSKLIGAAASTATGSDHDREGNCCEPKTASDCADVDVFCPTNAGTTADACVKDCSTCSGYTNLPETVPGTPGAYEADISGAGDTCGGACTGAACE